MGTIGVENAQKAVWKRRHFETGALLLSLAAGSANAAIDSVKIVVDTPLATGSFADVVIGSFAYDPTNDRMFITGAGGANLQLRLIENVSGVQTATTLIYATAWTKFTKGGNLDYGGGTPFPLSILLNPRPIPSLGLAAFGNAWIMDASPIVTEGSPPIFHPELTQRIYRYNLQADTNDDASDEFTSVLTLAQMQTIGSFTNTTTGSGRQMTWSGDGQKLYFIDSTPWAGGIYAVPAGGGTGTLLLRTMTTANSEPAVTSSGTIDTIYFRGTGTNSGGIDRITYNGTVASARQNVISSSTINEFLELSTGTAAISAYATDDDGNLYFANTGSNSTRPGIYRLDPSGRFSKVLTRTERIAAFGATKGSLIQTISKMQTRLTSFSNGSNSFPITQLLYSEIPMDNALSAIAGAFVFKPGDFNRDNEVNQSDIADFKLALTTKGTVATTDNLKYDLNGNDEVSWKDVKILQQFYPFPDGDATIDRVVDIADLWQVASHWQLTAQTWIQGDFTGDGVVNSLDLSILSSHWQETSAGQSFQTALSATGLAVLVPEPSLILPTLVTLGVLRRRRHSK